MTLLELISTQQMKHVPATIIGIKGGMGRSNYQHFRTEVKNTMEMGTYYLFI